MMTDIKEKVYEKLWDLFKDECPFIFNNKNQFGDFESFKHRFHYFFDSDMAKIWTILLEILPAEIGINDCSWTKEVSFQIINKKQAIVIDYVLLVNMFKSRFNKDIWESFHSLLEAIEELVKKEGDKIEFRWGEEK